MEANEAPEEKNPVLDKIYLGENSAPNCSVYHSYKVCKSDIEYTRTDAFIEKAKKCLIEWAGLYVRKTTGGGVNERKRLAKDVLNYFENYMKEL